MKLKLRNTESPRMTYYAVVTVSIRAGSTWIQLLIVYDEVHGLKDSIRA